MVILLDNMDRGIEAFPGWGSIELEYALHMAGGSVRRERARKAAKVRWSK